MSFACLECLRRAWLIAALNGHIDRAACDAPGKRVRQILSLSNEQLLTALAPGKESVIENRIESVSEDEMRTSIAANDSWAVCRHDPGFPQPLLEMKDHPVALFGRGEPELLARLIPSGTVTVVGSRRASAYGLGVARELGRDLALSGLTVVSGMALGIDGAVHTGALEAGLSCAVLGSGVDRPYPARHRMLYQRHLERGLILSELPSGTDTRRWAFPARNRLMAALAGMTVVVEAAERSGSLITADIAEQLGRDIGAVPGPVTARGAAGPNALLGQGACLVRGAQDVLDAMLGTGHGLSPTVGPPLEPSLKVALECFERHDGNWDSIEAELARAGVAAAAALAELELLGYLRCSSLGTWTRTMLPVPGPGT